MEPGGAEWLARLPAALAACRERWSLRVGPLYPASHVSFVAPADDAEGRPVVLKIQFPHRESRFEAEALRCWGGDGAVRLLGAEPAVHALLLERCEPGTHLSAEAPDRALDVLVDLLPRLWLPTDQAFDTAEATATRWLVALEAEWERAGRPYERRLLEAAIDALQALPPTQGERVLVHQDLHADNVLAARREPWLVIDPKPLVAERELGAAPVVRSFELGHDRAAVRHRLDRLSAELGLDRERVRGWTVAQTLAWACSNGTLHQPHHIETVRWLLD